LFVIVLVCSEAFELAKAGDSLIISVGAGGVTGLPKRPLPLAGGGLLNSPPLTPSVGGLLNSPPSLLLIGAEVFPISVISFLSLPPNNPLLLLSSYGVPGFFLEASST
jgi:hypothetical protein